MPKCTLREHYAAEGTNALPTDAGSVRRFVARTIGLHSSAVIHSVLVIAAAFTTGGAAAQPMPKEGKYDIISCWSGTSSVIVFSKTHSASSFELVGNNRTNPPGGPFDLTTFRCVGMNSTLDGQFTGANYCEAIDKDGDKWMVRNTNQGPKGTSETLAGTGKYEGMVRTGSTESLGAFPAIKPGTFTGCSRQIGSYKLK